MAVIFSLKELKKKNLDAVLKTQARKFQEFCFVKQATTIMYSCHICRCAKRCSLDSFNQLARQLFLNRKNYEECSGNKDRRSEKRRPNIKLLAKTDSYLMNIENSI